MSPDDHTTVASAAAAIGESLPEPDLDDPDNPEWTEEDFARAEGPESLPPAVLAAFPRTLQALQDQGKAPQGLVALWLDPAVIDHFKAQGADWQARINAVLRAAMDT